jgi:pyruvate,water dikinase
MNSDLNKAIGFLCKPEIPFNFKNSRDRNYTSEIQEFSSPPEDYWRWRYHMAETIASKLSASRFGVEALYVFGSTKNASAGPSSDIDILIHSIGNNNQKKDLINWLEGWSLTLSEINFLKTGYKTDGILDIHFITDKDIEDKTSNALKINAFTDAAHELKIEN